MKSVLDFLRTTLNRLQSGSPIMFGPMNDTDYYQPTYDTLVAKVGCGNTADSLQCLRGVPFTQLNAAINATNNSLTEFWPIVDGDFIKKYTSIQLTEGDFVKVPILIGTNTNEGMAFGPRGIPNEQVLMGNLIGRGVPPSAAAALLAAYTSDEAEKTISPGFQAPASFGAVFKRTAL